MNKNILKMRTETLPINSVSVAFVNLLAKRKKEKLLSSPEGIDTQQSGQWQQRLG